RRLIEALERNQHALIESVNADFGTRSATETRFVEVLGPILQARHAITHLRRWMRTRRRRTEWLFAGNAACVTYQPKGVVGILGTWNFPVYLTLGPLIAALAAGNRAIIKHSEHAPNTLAVLERLLSEAFPPDEVAIIGGGPAVGHAFCGLGFDHLIYTGSSEIGRDVMRAAGGALTPVTLELGGKSPAIVGSRAPIGRAAMRIAHGKTFNAGQTCVAPDHAWVHRAHADAFCADLVKAFRQLAPTIAGNVDYTSLAAPHRAARIHDLLDDARANGAEVTNCHVDAGADRRIPLHIVRQCTPALRVSREEIFGPILPVYEYEDFDQLLDRLATRERPLAMYGFGLTRAERRRLIERCPCGGVTFDDWGWHAFQHDLPFGGTGRSGFGSYHGEEGFRELSHAMPVLRIRRWFPVALFHPPYGRPFQKAVLRYYLGKNAAAAAAVRRPTDR
ncbi:MAG: aldehyde dehydrogenase family protein, partial [Gammaproteobacteria bacterium]|nr:aldehyde dehydrogenase family protein [Gammaproteobacteria bacterium]